MSIKRDTDHQKVGVFVDVQNMFYAARKRYNGKLNYQFLLEAAIRGRNLIRAVAYLIRTPDGIGSSKKWIGTFEAWIEDEFNRDKINSQEKEEIFRLCLKWRKNPDPIKNGLVKNELTQYLTKIIWERR